MPGLHLAPPQFPRYTSGFTLCEVGYMHVPFVHGISDYKMTAGHWPFSEQISKVATQNLNQLGLNCVDGQPCKLVLLIDQIFSLILHSSIWLPLSKLASLPECFS